MFEQLEELIKPDNGSKTRFIELKNEFYDNKKLMDAKLLTRARITAVVIGLVVVISMIILLIAFVKKLNLK